MRHFVTQLYSPAASSMRFARDIAFGSYMRFARLKVQGRMEYHCERSEQYHDERRESYHAAQGGILLPDKSKFEKRREEIGKSTKKMKERAFVLAKQLCILTKIFGN